jgi:ABC-type sugar transport system ATPase subunit
MRLEIIKLHRQQQAISIYVTHDQVEAMTMADKIVVMRDGHIEQVGSPLDLYNEPVNQFVAGFLGTPKMNFLPARLTGLTGDALTLSLGSTSITAALKPGASVGTAAGADVTVGVRADGWRIVAPGQGLAGSVVHAEQLGRETVTFVALADEQQVTLIEPGQHRLADGEAISIAPDPAQLHVFGADGLSLPLIRAYGANR